MQSQSMKSLAIVAAVLGRKNGVKVVVCNDTTARTDGKTIYLPSMGTQELSETVLCKIRGYIDHESAHIRWTDFSVSVDAFLNILEDIRIEQRMMTEYPGSHKNLCKLVEVLVSEGAFGIPDETWHPAAIAGAYTSFRLRADVLGQTPLAPARDKVREHAVQVFGPDRVAALDAYLDGFAPRSTEDCREVKKRILEILFGRQEQPQDADGDGGGEKSSEEAGESASSGTPEGSSNDGGEESSGNPSAPKESGEEESGDSGGESGDSGSSGEPGDSPGDGGEESSGEAGDRDDPRNGPTRQGDGGEESSEESGDSGDPQSSGGNSGDSGQSNGSTFGGDSAGSGSGEAPWEWPKWVEDELATHSIGGYLEKQIGELAASGGWAVGRVQLVEWDESWRDSEARKHFARAEAIGARLRAVLMQHLQSMSLVRNATRRSGTFLNARQLARLAVGDSRVFRGRSWREDTRALVYLVFDRSGSMANVSGHLRKCEYAGIAALALAHALVPVREIEFEAIAFPGIGPYLSVLFLHRMGERVIDPWRMFPFPSGGTPLHAALAYVYQRMVEIQFAEQMPRRKCVIVITDGDPDNRAACISEIRGIRDLGVDLYGIGIPGAKEPTLRFLFGEGNCAVVFEPETLPGVLNRLLIRRVLAA